MSEPRSGLVQSVLALNFRLHRRSRSPFGITPAPAVPVRRLGADRERTVYFVVFINSAKKFGPPIDGLVIFRAKRALLEL